MEVTALTLLISSADPARLTEFYRDVVGLEVDEQVGGLKMGDGGHLLIDAHSEISGPNPEPARFMVNFFVKDLDAEQTRMESQGVKFIRTAGREYWGGVISTFVDPDGNYAQLIEFRPE